MKKIIVKIPRDKNDKWRLQRRGQWKSRQYKTLTGLINRLHWVSSSSKLREKTSLVIKKYNGATYEIINETCESSNGKYHIWCLINFLEDYLTRKTFLSYHKHYKGERP